MSIGRVAIRQEGDGRGGRETGRVGVMVGELKEGWDNEKEGKGEELERRRRGRRNRVGGGGGGLFRFREAPWRAGAFGEARWWRRGRRKRESIVGRRDRVTTRRCC